jgi:hypothetical protein|tara:strand:- start:4059 stop:5993 length:1935 start_codon:yes stop_codon:yes gene_type:complete
MPDLDRFRSRQANLPRFSQISRPAVPQPRGVDSGAALKVAGEGIKNLAQIAEQFRQRDIAGKVSNAKVDILGQMNAFEASLAGRSDYENFIGEYQQLTDGLREKYGKEFKDRQAQEAIGLYLDERSAYGGPRVALAGWKVQRQRGNAEALIGIKNFQEMIRTTDSTGMDVLKAQFVSYVKEQETLGHLSPGATKTEFKAFDYIVKKEQTWRHLNSLPYEEAIRELRSDGKPPSYLDPNWRGKVKVVGSGGREKIIYDDGTSAFVGDGTPAWWTDIPRHAQEEDVEEVITGARNDFDPTLKGIMVDEYEETNSFRKVVDRLKAEVKKGNVSDWLMFETAPKGAGAFIRENINDTDRKDMIRELKQIEGERRTREAEAISARTEETQNTLFDLFIQRKLTIDAVNTSSLPVWSKDRFRRMLDTQAAARLKGKDDPFKTTTDYESFHKLMKAASAGEIGPDIPLMFAGKGISSQDTFKIRDEAIKARKAKDNPVQKEFNDKLDRMLAVGRRAIVKGNALIGTVPQSEIDAYEFESSLRAQLSAEADPQTRIKMVTPGAPEFIGYDLLQKYTKTAEEQMEGVRGGGFIGGLGIDLSEEFPNIPKPGVSPEVQEEALRALAVLGLQAQGIEATDDAIEPVLEKMREMKR